jgi:hypothetical protein
LPQLGHIDRIKSLPRRRISAFAAASPRRINIKPILG